MIAAVIAASAVMAGLIGLAVALAVWLRGSYVENGVLREDKLVEMRRGDDLEDERDEFSNEAGRLLKENQELRDRLIATERQRNELVAQGVRHALQRVGESTDPMDAARLVRELLEAELPGTTQADSAPAGGGEG